MPRRLLHGVIVLAVALVTATGCSSKPALTPQQQAKADLAAYQAQIREAVPDPARADQLVALADEFNELAWKSIASMNDYRAKVATLNSNYEATRNDYESLFNQQDAVRQDFVHKAIALREKMAALTTGAEWGQLTKARLQVLETALQDLFS